MSRRRRTLDDTFGELSPRWAAVLLKRAVLDELNMISSSDVAPELRLQRCSNMQRSLHGRSHRGGKP